MANEAQELLAAALTAAAGSNMVTDADLARTRRAMRAEVTYDKYASFLRRVAKWVVATYINPDSLERQFVAPEANPPPNAPPRQTMRRLPGAVLGDESDAQLVDLFCKYAETGQRRGLRYTTLAHVRCSLNSLFFETSAGLVPDALQGMLKSFFSGLRKQDARKVRDGQTLHGDCAKSPISFTAMSSLARTMMCSANVHWRWLHLVWLLSFNLLARTDNIVNLHVRRMAWSGDSLCVRWGITKTMQSGEERLNDPAHVYANPYDASICPITALGLYLVAFGTGMGGGGKPGRLFEGEPRTIKNRATENLSSVSNSQDVKAVLRREGREPKDIGMYTLRKSGASYATTGTTAAPNFIAVKIRMTHKVLTNSASVDSRYFHYSAAADQYLGRVLAGLDPMSYEFGGLPPHFPPGREDVARAVRSVFPASLQSSDHMTHFAPVLEMCLASMVWHSPWIQANVHSTADVLRSPLFTLNLAKELLPFVCTGLKSPYMKPRGLPPYIPFYKEFQEQKLAWAELKRIFVKETTEIRNSVDRVETRVQEAVGKAFHEEALQAGTIDSRVLDDKLAPLLLELRRLHSVSDGAFVQEGADRGNSDADDPAENGDLEGVLPGAFSSWSYGGKMGRRLPEDWGTDPPYSRMSWPQAFEWWCCGVPVRGIAPLRSIKPFFDVVPKAKSKFDYLRAVFTKLEKYLRVLHNDDDPLRLNSILTPSDAAERLPAVKDATTGMISVVEDITRTRGARRTQQRVRTSTLRVATISKYFRGRNAEERVEELALEQRRATAGESADPESDLEQPPRRKRRRLRRNRHPRTSTPPAQRTQH